MRPTRREAAARLARVLETTRIQGITTNRDFLVATLRTTEFLAGDTTTDFIERVKPPRARLVPHAERIDAAIVVAIESQARRRACGDGRLVVAERLAQLDDADGAHRVCSGAASRTWSSEHAVCVEYRARRDRRFDVVVDATPMLVDVYACGDGTVDIAIDGRRINCAVDRHGDRWFVQTELWLGRSDRAAALSRRPAPTNRPAACGRRCRVIVLKTEVRVGDAVVKGQLLLILEAMKMEHRITAPRDGTVEVLHVALGDQVVNGALLVTIGDGAPHTQK